MIHDAYIFCNGEKELINKEFRKSLSMNKEYYKYLFYGDILYYDIVDELYNNNGGERQYVSVNEYGDILGFFCAYINKLTYCIDDVIIAKFISNSTAENDLIFKTDLEDFIKILIQNNKANSIIITTAICNKRMVSYLDKWCIMYNGKYIGKEYGTIVKNGLLIDKLIYQFATNRFIEYSKSKMENSDADTELFNMI